MEWGPRSTEEEGKQEGFAGQKQQSWVVVKIFHREWHLLVLVACSASDRSSSSFKKPQVGTCALVNIEIEMK
jgi:hypothetical protein